jgi:hypothetical protein
MRDVPINRGALVAAQTRRELDVSQFAQRPLALSGAQPAAAEAPGVPLWLDRRSALLTGQGARFRPNSRCRRLSGFALPVLRMRHRAPPSYILQTLVSPPLLARP